MGVNRRAPVDSLDTLGSNRQHAVLVLQHAIHDQKRLADDDHPLAVEKIGAKASILVADLTREEDCRAIARTAVERYGRIDILHNNVGRSRGDRSTTELDEAMWTELMDMNLKGMWLTCKF